LKKQGRIQGYPPEPQYRPEEDREQRHGHSFTPGMAGGLLAGAAAVGAGAYAYHEHDKHQKERADDEVIFILHLF
jgi:hypothetical protein